MTLFDELCSRYPNGNTTFLQAIVEDCQSSGMSYPTTEQVAVILKSVPDIFPYNWQPPQGWTRSDNRLTPEQEKVREEAYRCCDMIQLNPPDLVRIIEAGCQLRTTNRQMIPHNG